MERAGDQLIKAAFPVPGRYSVWEDLVMGSNMLPVLANTLRDRASTGRTRDIQFLVHYIEDANQAPCLTGIGRLNDQDSRRILASNVLAS